MNSHNNKEKKDNGLFEGSFNKFTEIAVKFMPLSVFAIAATQFLYNGMYFPSIGLYLEPYLAAALFAVVIGIVQMIFSTQRFFSDTLTGMILSSFVSVEACLLLIFAQYHPVAAVLVSVASICIFLFIARLIGEINIHNRNRIRNFRKKCRKLSFRLTAFIVAIILMVPSVMGIYTEFFCATLTEKEWNEFYEWYNSLSFEEEEEPTEESEHPLADLAKWDSLSLEDKERLIRVVAEIEKEYLGIGDLTIEYWVEVNTAKMDEHTLAFFSRFSSNVFINVRHLNEAPLENVISTVLHELHHAYVFHTLDILDFDSPEVQTSFYFESARQWKENSENYVNGSTSYEDYYSQPIERDARAHSEARTPYYMQFAESYG